jgi:hypothetical protein
MQAMSVASIHWFLTTPLQTFWTAASLLCRHFVGSA